MLMIDTTPASLLLRLRDPRDDAAWTRFATLYLPLVRGFCSRRGLQPAAAADVAQEVLRAVAQSIESFEYAPERGSFRGWLFRVIRSKLANHFQSRKRQPRGTGSTTVHERLGEEPDGSWEEWEERWERDHQVHLFRWAAEQVRPELQERTWEAFWRTAVLGRDATQAAHELSMTLGALYVARSRVLAKLKETVSALAEPEFLLAGSRGD